MEKETLKKIFDFLEKNDNKRKPLMWKLENNIPIIEKDDLIVKGSLDLSSSNITSLPKGLEVKGGLSLYESEIISLPEGLKVHGDLFIADTKLEVYTDEELREMVKPGFIKGDIIR
jgi:hypothetical protein